MYNISAKPNIKKETSVVNGEIGGRAEIECIPEGHPLPNITWFKTNTPLVVDNPSFQYYTTHNNQRLNFVASKVGLCLLLKRCEIV